MNPQTSTRRMANPERRQAILDTAGPMFAARGYFATRLGDVAEAMGVTKPVVYRHFDSKRELYLAILRRHEDDLPAFTQDLDPSRVTNLDQLAELLDGWLDYVAVHPYAWQILFRDRTADEGIETVRGEVSARAREVLVPLVAASAAPRAEVESTAEFLRSGLAGLVLWWIDHPRTSKAMIHATATRLVAQILRQEKGE